MLHETGYEAGLYSQELAAEADEQILADMEAAGVTVEMDLRNEKIGYKVREHSRAKTPRIWVIGEQEAQQNQVAIRTLGSQATETMDLDEAVAALAAATRLPI